MNAVILAAGTGSRLGTAVPKGLIEIGGTAIVERQIDALNDCGVSRICIVTGYDYARLECRFGDRADFRYNPFHACSNNMVSLLFARDWIADDVVILYADLLYDPAILAAALASHDPIAVTVDRTAIAPGHALVAIRDGMVRAIGSDVAADVADARFVGIATLRRDGLDACLAELDEAAKAGLTDHYYTVALARLVARGHPVAAIDVEGRRWQEIDTPDDLARARRDWG